MQRPWPLLVALLGAALVPGAVALSPVTRVVQLLEGLSANIEKEGKKEEDLYESFVCWGKSIINQKTESNAASKSRIDMLTAYIADLDAGRIELTTERQDLEKEIESLTGDIEVATSTRNREKADYEEAKAEMNQAITALEDASEVLKTATEGHEQGSLLRIRGQASQGFAARSREAASLQKAVQLGQKVLTKGDALFLRRLLTAEVPTADWKKLNRKATFKANYKARSGKIQGVLAKLLQSFSENLAEATEKEQEAQALFDKLEGTKKAQLTAAQEALQRMDAENGAKGMSRADSEDELDKLNTQVTDDTKYIDQVKQSLADKKGEWKDRKELRAGELAAISKAISILHSDDARDLFKKSFKSQDKSKAFLQLTETSRGAFETLKSAAKATKDSRLSMLAARLATGGHFDDVISAIDNMVQVLKDEEASDLRKKETCEKDRADNTRDAAKASRSIDEMTDAVTVLEGEIKDLQKEVEEKEGKIAEIQTQLAEAKKLRDEENADYLVAKKEDQDAKTLVANAAAVIGEFYTSNNLMLAQQKKQTKQPATSVAGQAPPPPPTTWEAPYGGKTGESTGIVAILGMIEQDIAKDIAKADSEEADSLAMYTTTKTALEGEEQNLNGQIVTMNSTMAGKEQDVETTKGSRTTKKGELGAIMKEMADAEEFCNFFTVNYPLRLKNRQIEIDGLTKAKAILQGGAFAKPADPNREMKPGDALLQGKKAGRR